MVIKSKKKATIWNLIFIYSRLFLSFIRGIAIVPLYLKYFDASIYGYWLATGNILAWLVMVDPGTGEILEQRIGEQKGKNNLNEVSRLIASGLFSSLLIMIIGLILGFVLSYFIGNIIRIDTHQEIIIIRKAFQLAVISMALQFLVFSFNGINKGLLEIKTFGFITLITNMLGIITTIFALVHFKLGVISIPLGNLVFSSTSVILNSIILIHRFASDKIRPILNYFHFYNFIKIFSYTFFSKIMAVISQNIDLIIISRYIDSEIVTSYELTKRPIKFINGLVKRSSISFIPGLANLKGKENLKRFQDILIRYINLLVFSGILVTLGFIIFNKFFIPLWTGKNLYLGNTINLLLCTFLFIESITYSLSNFTFSFGNIKGNSTISIIKSVLYIVLLFISVIKFGLIGLVICGIIALLATEFWYYPYFLINNLKTEIRSIKTLLIQCLKYCIIAVSLYFPFTHFTPNNWLKLCYFSGFLIISYSSISFVVSANFRHELLQLYKKNQKK